MPGLSVIIPCLNEAEALPLVLAPLQGMREAGHEVILVDGGSTDGSTGLAFSLVDRVLTAERGRAAQMNAGAALASGEAFWFLHADTLVPVNAADSVVRAMAGGATWGRFDVRLDAPGAAFRIIEWCMNQRSRLTGIATGDQALFVRRDAFEAVGGFPLIPLMEDVALSGALRRQGRPYCSAVRVRTSARRWERFGVLPTVLQMWQLRYRFWRGDNPQELARLYRQGPR
ncbi:TIGR04283 family arsenosugar biosynthesis glycosyltransferase [Methylonatrum kenyense]|uniref:TIGR04283 family arsenosugar biosynthesis glycosyltransferase n=1 Tax=Methylonatrum kenyense TaxID=455253 RepID=UPI0020BD5408|nr:TIGR04283 family arsenosugar biosynthesis glycosyltransferase [Methylonatrum kenyense]MCK8514874.1 TIGR04283 family arsenosugar biosynthesis glycosyltransferase [Methylonatrum kenyense]